jgi:hypothetical protein
VSFNETIFAGQAGFESAKFGDSAWFANAVFTGEASFIGSVFETNVLFYETTFEDDVRFNQAIFKGHTGFTGSIFRKSSCFSAVRGQSFFTLKRTAFFFVPDFEQAHFAEAPRLDDSYFRLPNGDLYKFSEQRSSGIETDVTARWRALRRIAVQGHDHELELIFLAEEIKSRRGVQDWALPNPLCWRRGDPISWPGGGRYWAGFLYEWFSDFGRSAVRPLLWWTFLTCSFAFYFHSLSPHANANSHNAFSIASFTCSEDLGESGPMVAALYISVHNGLVISGLSRTEVLAQSYSCLYGIEGKNRYLYEVVFAGLAQTIISAALIFLFLLALRNYFRIR